MLHLGLRRRRLARARRAQQQRHHGDDNALADAEIEKGGLVTRSRDDLLDRHDGQRRAGAKAGRGQPGAQTAPVGEPFQRVADAGAVDRAGADPADRRGDVEEGQRIGHRVHDPGDPDQNPADQHDDLRAEAVDKPALDRHQPGLGQDEDAERHLDRGAAPLIFGIDRQDEQRPAILQVGDHHHAGDAERQLHPSEAR